MTISLFYANVALSRSEININDDDCHALREINIDEFYQGESLSLIEHLEEHLFYPDDLDQIINPDFCINYYDILEVIHRVSTLSASEYIKTKNAVKKLFKAVSSANKKLKKENAIFGFHIIQMLDASSNIAIADLSQDDKPIVRSCIIDINGDCLTGDDKKTVINMYRPPLCQEGNTCKKGMLNLAHFYEMLSILTNNPQRFLPQALIATANTLYTTSKSNLKTLTNMINRDDIERRGFSLVTTALIIPFFPSGSAAISAIKKVIDSQE